MRRKKITVRWNEACCQKFCLNNNFLIVIENLSKYKKFVQCVYLIPKFFLVEVFYNLCNIFLSNEGCKVNNNTRKIYLGM